MLDFPVVVITSATDASSPISMTNDDASLDIAHRLPIVTDTTQQPDESTTPCKPRQLICNPSNAEQVTNDTDANNAQHSKFDGIIMNSIFSKRQEMTDVSPEAEEERRRRMGAMIRSSRKYNRMNVSMVNQHFEADKDGNIGIEDFIAQIAPQECLAAAGYSYGAGEIPTTTSEPDPRPTLPANVDTTPSNKYLNPTLNVIHTSHPGYFSSKIGGMLEIPDKLFGRRETHTNITECKSTLHEEKLESADDAMSSNNTLASKTCGNPHHSALVRPGLSSTRTHAQRPETATGTVRYRGTGKRQVAFLNDVVLFEGRLYPCGSPSCTCSIDVAYDKKSKLSIKKFLNKMFQHRTSTNTITESGSPWLSATSVSSISHDTTKAVSTSRSSSTVQTSTSDVAIEEIDNIEPKDEEHDEVFSKTKPLHLAKADAVEEQPHGEASFHRKTTLTDICPYAIDRTNRAENRRSPFGVIGLSVPSLAASQSLESGLDVSFVEKSRCSILNCPESIHGPHMHAPLQDNWFGGKKLRKDGQEKIILRGLVLRVPPRFTSVSEGRMWSREHESSNHALFATSQPFTPTQPHNPQEREVSIDCHNNLDIVMVPETRRAVSESKKNASNISIKKPRRIRIWKNIRNLLLRLAPTTV
ncbi:hypothetical protein QVD99_003635 [Batrachochytrium dendrobatidis]|nr:hypothetical protein O5D80_003943 [Batrachochytrium dendrobatidis]KAK5669223.1 hypothetical protein QVD99_003635 [Batrachochytrium dendrobatidis]